MDNKKNMNDIIKKINTINDLIINNIESAGFQKEFELEQKERCYNKYINCYIEDLNDLIKEYKIETTYYLHNK